MFHLKVKKMATIKQGSQPSVPKSNARRRWLMPFGIGGTLLLAGALTLVSPLLGALVAATPLAYLTANKVLLPAWRSVKQQAASLLRPGRSKVPSGDYGNLKVNDGGKTGNGMVDALVDKLRHNGLQVSTDWNAAKDILQQLPEKYEALKRDDAKVYGFVYRGTVFLNPKETGPDVPIHEYTHVWAEALRQRNPQEWQRIVELMKRETAIWNEVVKTYPHLENDDQIADEVLATYSGRHGAQRLAEYCQEGEKPQQVFKNLLAALERFWKDVSLFFKRDVHYNTASDLADRVLSDFLTGVNPNKYIDENTVTLNDSVPLASQGSHITNNSNTTMNQRLETLLSTVLPDNGRIELPRPFALDQRPSVGVYDMNARYILRTDDGFRFSDGDYTLPLSRLMDHQVGDLCDVLEEYQRNDTLKASDKENARVDAAVLGIRQIVAEHGRMLDTDVFLQNPVNIGHGMQVVGVSVALSNTRDDAVILKHKERNALHYSDYRYYDGDLQHGTKVVNTLSSRQLAAVSQELLAMAQRHTLVPVNKGYYHNGSQMFAAVDGAYPDRMMTGKLRVNPIVSGFSSDSKCMLLTMKDEAVYRGVTDQEQAAFNRAAYQVAQRLINRNCAVKEGDDVVVILDDYSRANLDREEEPLKNAGGDALKSLEVIAKAIDGDAAVIRESDHVVKVRFSDGNAANRFAGDYFQRSQIARSAVSHLALLGGWSDMEKEFVKAYLVEHGGVDKPTREAAAERLFNTSGVDALDVADTRKDSVRNELQGMAQSIPVVTYYFAEAKDKFNEIMAGQQSTEAADYFPLHIGACGIFEETTGDGQRAFVAFDNSNGDNWTEDFKTMKGAELYVGGVLSVDDIRQLERQQFRTIDKPLLIDTIILSKDDVSGSLAKKLPFDEQGELEVKMAFYDGYAEELRQRDGVELSDGDRLKLTYPTIAAVAASQKMQDAIEDFTDRQWRGSTLGEKVYDIALKYGNAGKLYERVTEVPMEIGDVEFIAQDALYERITDTDAHVFTGQQKQAFTAYQQSFGTDADKSLYLSERLMKGIQDRLAAAEVPESRVNDAQHELAEFFRGVDRDVPQKTEADFVKLAMPYLNDRYESVLIPASVPVHENPSGKFAHQINQTQGYTPQSLGVLFNVKYLTMQVLYDHHHTMESGHEYHTVLGLPFDQLTPKEVNSLFDSLQGDLEEKGKLLAAGITESEDDNEEVLFDVAFDLPHDEQQQELADKHQVETVDEENNISSFNDYDDAIYFAAENLAALQQRPDYGQDLRDKDSVVSIIIERMKDSSARAFTPEQAQTVRDYVAQSNDVKQRMADVNDLYYSAASSSETKNIPDSWKDDVRKEMDDLALGIFRDESRGMHR